MASSSTSAGDDGSGSGKLSDFKALVTRYASLSDELAASSKTMRDLRARARELGESILDFMRKNEIDEVEVTGSGKLCRRVSRRTGPLSKELIAEELKSHVQPDRVPEVIEKIMGRRETTESTTLKRVKN